MAVVEITCPHCSARTYVTFVRQTGTGSCPECGTEIADVFQYSSKGGSGIGTMLGDTTFSDSSATIIASGPAPERRGTAPLELSGADFGSPTGEVPMPADNAPDLSPSLSGPSLMPLESAPMLAPSSSAPSLMPSNSAPTLEPSNSAPSMNTAGNLLTPPPPRLRQFAVEDLPETAVLSEIPAPKPTRRPTGSLGAAAKSEPEKATRPTLPLVNLGEPRRPTAPVATKRPTAPVAVPTRRPTAPIALPTKRPTGAVAKPATATLPKPMMRRPTASLAAAAAPAAPAPARKPTATLPAPARRPTQSLPPRDELGPVEELSLLTPPPAQAPAPASRATTAKRPTSALPKSEPISDAGGRSYPPIRAPGVPGQPGPTRTLTVVGLGEAPRLPGPPKPENFGTKKFDPGLTKLGYTMPGSDVSHFDLPPPSPMPFTAASEASEEAPAALPPPGPKPGTRIAMKAPPPPKTDTRVAPAPPQEADFEVVDDAEDAPAAAVSQASIDEGWAEEGPASGIGKVEIPDMGLDDDPSGEAETNPSLNPPDGDDEMQEDLDDGGFVPGPPAKPLPAPQKAAPAAPKPAPARTPKAPTARLEPPAEAVRYRPVRRFDAEEFWTRALIYGLYTVCAAGAVAFLWLMYKVHILKEAVF
ncbi:MAG: hypothetical protein DCC64_05680 [Planctomycetota bacterium]|nr:MAG: hypothetical protein DCC64_05680 [Planctomycetota bacterium]